MIDLVANGESYVIEYVVEKGYGLSRQSTAVFGWEGLEELGVRKLVTTTG